MIQVYRMNNDQELVLITGLFKKYEKLISIVFPRKASLKDPVFLASKFVTQRFR